MISVILYSEIIKCFLIQFLADLVYSQVVPGQFGCWHDQSTVPMWQYLAVHFGRLRDTGTENQLGFAVKLLRVDLTC